MHLLSLFLLSNLYLLSLSFSLSRLFPIFISSQISLSPFRFFSHSSTTKHRRHLSHLLSLSLALEQPNIADDAHNTQTLL